jgi:hypothetical protein
MSLKVPCDVKSPQTAFTTGNIIRWRGYFVNRKKNYCIVSGSMLFYVNTIQYKISINTQI